MTRELFDKIYDEHISPFIREIADNNSLIDIKNQELCKRDIFVKYNKMKSVYKAQIFDKNEGLMDRHKIASCICAAFLQVSVFDKSRMVEQIKKDKTPIESFFYYVNELVAFYAANKFLSFFMVLDYKRDWVSQRKIIEEFPLMPSTLQSKKGFWSSVLFNLASIKDEDVIGLKHFDIYAYAMIFFMLENYFIEKRLVTAEI